MSRSANYMACKIQKAWLTYRLWNFKYTPSLPRIILDSSSYGYHSHLSATKIQSLVRGFIVRVHSQTYKTAISTYKYIEHES